MAGTRSSWRDGSLSRPPWPARPAGGLDRVLAVTLPWRYRAGGWSAAWVGFDAVLFLAFAATAWAAWRRRQVLILCLVVLATLLCCDAWFDTTLDWGTPGFIDSLTLALVVELPLAVVAMIGARRLLRLTFGRLHALKDDSGPVPPLWKVPLFGDYSAGQATVTCSASRARTRTGPGRIPPTGWHRSRTRDARRRPARLSRRCRWTYRYDGTGWAASSAASAAGRSGNRNR